MFVLAKVLWFLAQPASLLLLATLAALLFHRRWPRLSRGLLVGASLLWLALVLLPLDRWVLQPLEGRYTVPQLAAPVDGIIVLGGALDAELSVLHRQSALEDSAERLVEGAILAQLHPAARLVFSGGTGRPFGPRLAEADEVSRLWSKLGISPHRIELERESRDTYENALFSQRLVQPQPGQTWLLVTSAFHMPRAMLCFERIGWPVTAYPVDYRVGDSSGPQRLEPVRQLYSLTLGSREWVGLAAYRLMGRTERLWP